jgi:hypothetical protein
VGKHLHNSVPLDGLLGDTSAIEDGAGRLAVLGDGLVGHEQAVLVDLVLVSTVASEALVRAVVLDFAAKFLPAHHSADAVVLGVL